MSETELIDGCKAGKKEAFEELYKLYSRQMYGVCCRYVGEDVAYDVMHDGFIKVFSSIGTFRASNLQAFKFWITRIMVNTSLQHLRNLKSNLFLPVDQLEEELEPVEEEDITLVPIDLLLKFIAELPVGYRMVLHLALFEGLSHKEIAQATGINAHSSSSQLYRAKSLLAEKVRAYLNQQDHT